MTALVFDCDGVLADTERYGHLPAFNQTFEEFGLPAHWSEDDYAERLKIAGGKERLASLLTPEFVAAAGLPADRESQLAEVARWHRRKTEIYLQIVSEGRLPPRPGVGRLAREARDAGWALTVCSTSAEASVRATLESSVGHDVAAGFLVLAGDIVAHKKPAPDIYLLALDRLGAAADEVVVIEDSANGLQASTAAGLHTVVTVNAYTADEDFSTAALVVTSLGDPDGEVTSVLAARAGVRPTGYVTIADLTSILD